jgi:hypothetical protein
VSDFFFDECVSKYLARMLDAWDRRHTVRHISEDSRLGVTASDVEIINVLSREEIPEVLVTADCNMKRVADERKALKESGLTVIFLARSFSQLTPHTQAWKLLKLWPTVTREVDRVKVPTAFEITSSANKLNRIRPTDQL